MAQKNTFVAGNEICVTSDPALIREELVDLLGKSGTVVDTLDHVVLVHLSGEDAAFMIRAEELIALRDPKSWSIGETVRVLHDYEEKDGTIATPHLILDGEVKYGVQVDDGHAIVAAKDFIN